jgi:hypothetical protein
MQNLEIISTEAVMFNEIYEKAKVKHAFRGHYPRF